MRTTRYLTTSCLLALLLSGCAPSSIAQVENDDYVHGERPKKAQESLAKDEANQKKYKGDANILVLPGLIANRKEQYVDSACETTTLEARGASEYLIIDQDSSNGYEAMIWSFAKPGDIHTALEFIGMKSGRPRDNTQMRFWPKGEKVIASVLIGEDAIRIEKLIYDENTKTTLPEEGWIFTGSIVIDCPTGGIEKIYVADKYDPRSIIAAYNEVASVLDPPWSASKGEFYDSHVASPDFKVGQHELITVRYEPALKNGETVVRDLVLTVTEDLSFILTKKETGKKMTDKATLDAALEECKKLVADGREPFVTVKFDDALTISQIKGICSVLVMLDTKQGLRIDPPEIERLYYKAFLPNTRWLDAGGRSIQPWEVHLDLKDGELSGNMVFHEVDWKPGQSKPDLTKKTYPIKSGADIRSRLDKYTKEREAANERPPPPVLLVYATKDLRYGQLLKFIKPALSTHGIIHLFQQEEIAEIEMDLDKKPEEKPENDKPAPPPAD